MNKLEETKKEERNENKLTDRKKGVLMKLNSKGFSLVELMVVVAIIGILASVAVPSINKYMAKSRQTEAKANLGAYYSSNKAFFSEYSLYAAWFGVIGYQPEGRMRYRIGVPGAVIGIADLNARGYTLAALPAPPGNAIDNQVYCGGVVGVVANGCALLTEGFGQGLGAGVIGALGVNFTAVAAGVVRQGGAADTWTINNLKVLTNTIDGTL